ncbi:MAG TPA: hypothetical protein VGW38_09610 [Chloroflexota bacterium]|nr:hypothetical protein [Chloroflexota bacterium]
MATDIPTSNNPAGGVAMAGGGSVPPAVIRGLTAFLAVVALLGFVTIAITGIVATINAEGEAPTFNASLLYVASAVGALVGGVVAVAFGQKPPPDPKPNPSLLTLNLSALTTTTTAKASAGQLIGGAYAVLYVLLGVAAVIIWVIYQDQTAEHVKALASTFMGLVVPIVRSFFASD